MYFAARYFGFWPLNEKYAGKHIGVNQNDGVLYNTRYIDGPFKGGQRAVKFVGTINSYVSISQSHPIHLNASYTFLIYASPTDIGGPVLETGFKGFHLWFYDTWNKWYHGWGYTIEVGAMRKNEWYFMGYSYNHVTQTLSAWVDAERIKQWTSVSQLKQTIGNGINLGVRDFVGVPWDGGVSCLMIYAEDLSKDGVSLAKQLCEAYHEGEICKSQS